MPDANNSGVPSVAEVRSRLNDTAGIVRDSANLDPAVRIALAELLDELSRALEAPEAQPAEVARLAQDAAHLAEALHHGHDSGLLETARHRLESLLLQAESRAPNTVGVTRRLIDALANLGI
jgi:Domain of unknown function (DUF4404)